MIFSLTSAELATLKSITMKQAINRLGLEIGYPQQLTDEVKIRREHNQVIELIWDNGKREILTVLDNELLDRGLLGVDMKHRETFNSTAIRRSLDALHTIL